MLWWADGDGRTPEGSRCWDDAGSVIRGPIDGVCDVCWGADVGKRSGADGSSYAWLALGELARAPLDAVRVGLEGAAPASTLDGAAVNAPDP